MNRKVVNFVAFQAGWFACVLSAANGLPWLGTFVAFFVVLAHLARSTSAMAELRLALFAVAIGAVFDSALVASGLLTYPSGMLAPWLAPYWILAMWALFATTLNLSMNWLKPLPLVVTALLGSLFGPLSYFAGARLGALVLVDMPVALLMLATAWAIALPLLVVAARLVNGIGPDRSSYPLRQISRRQNR